MTTDDRAEGTCAEVRDLLPLRAMGDPSVRDEEGVQRHLEDCQACRTEAEFLARLREARSEPPADLVANVLRRHERRESSRTPGPATRGRVAWSLSAAAGLVLALGIGLLWQESRTAEPIWSLALDPQMASWSEDDWMVAGEPLLDAVSEETLLALMEEMDG